ncbi:EthD domain-containing protein [Mycolicibacterium stellerae]|uniref:EthD domain-containing protein n=1 Tax=Mycolicibacterium stellerae TaxID=2358193 RepID=UPI000F0B95AE|nr:EthD domain-containing protein [Mycolicibacterium stellerae]
MIVSFKRKPGTTFEEFNDHWQNKHAPLVRSVKDVLRIKRYVQNPNAQSPFLAQWVEARGFVLGYDGTAEAWFESEEDMVAGNNSPEGQAATKMLFEDELKFLDPDSAITLIVNEREMINDL